jgi:YD repeat-containing protein
MKHHSLTHCARFTLTLFVILLCVTAPAVTTLHIEISPPSSANEFSSAATLVWDAQADLPYKIQSTTNLSVPEWKIEDLVTSSSNGPIRWMAPESLHVAKYYRIILPQPEIESVEPTLVDSSNPNALLYILGQLLPTNGLVVINGHILTPTIINSNGVWAALSLNGLPPGEPILGTITVLDSGSNVVATHPVQGPILYSTELTLEQLQGPPDDPPALRRYNKSNQSNDRRGPAINKLEVGSDATGRKNSYEGGTWRLPAVDATTGDAFFKSVTGLKSETEVVEHPEGGVNDGVRRAPAAEPRAAGLKAVCLPSGEFLCEETDLVIPGPGLDFTWTRTYRSRTGPTNALGHGWDFSYNMRLTPQPDGTVQFCTGDGRCDTFYPNGPNSWSRDEFFMTISDLNKDGIPDVVICADGTRVNFNPIAMDKPVSITDRNDNTMSFFYDGLGRLTTIVDTLGRSNLVSYNGSGRLASLTDFSGRVVRYEYDGNGDLARCVSPPVTGTPNGNDFPGGKTNSYAYSSGFADDRLNHNLLSCTDAKGQTSLQVVYQTNQNPVSLDFDAVASASCGGDKQDIWRGRLTPSPTNQFATIQVIVRDAVGNVTENFYDSRLRCVREHEYTGRSATNAPVTPSSNRPTNKLRASDPDYFVTQWEWNNDSLCKLIVTGATALGDGVGRINRVRMSYGRDFDSTVSARKKGDLMVLRELACCGGVDLDGDGIADVTERVWHFEHDTDFGSANMRTRINQLEAILKNHGLLEARKATDLETVLKNLGLLTARKGWDGTIKGLFVPEPNGVAINTKGTGAAKGRFANGPRQTVDLAGSNGPNSRAANEGTIRYNGSDFQGFATSIIDPRGTVTTHDYDEHGNKVKETVAFNGGNGVEVRAKTSRSYNGRGQLVAITNAPDANGYTRVDTFDYYTNGPQAGYCRQFIVDASGPTLIAWNFEYDSRGNLNRLVDPRANDWLFTWNQLDQLVERQTPNRGFGARTATTYTYDANNNVTRDETELRDSTDTLQHTIATQYQYDALNRLLSLTSQVATNQFVTNRFVYDANGNCIQIHSPLAVSGVDPHNYVAYEYDERGLLFREITAPGSGQSGTNEWSYNERSHPATKQYADDTTSFTEATCTYDGFERPTTVTDAMGNVATFAYDRNDNLVLYRAFCETNDVPGSAGNLRHEEWHWTYDGRDQCIEVSESLFNPATQTPLGKGKATTQIAFAQNGECSNTRDDNGHVTQFTYDSVGQLASVIDPKLNTIALAYDASGNVTNITRIERSDVTPGTQQFVTTYSYDALDRLVRSLDNVGNATSCSYDSLGRVIATVDSNTNTIAHAYDDLNRHTLAVADLNGDGQLDLAVDVNRSWSYDDNSRCIATTDDNTNTTSYAYDSLNRLVTTTEMDSTTCSLIWSPRSNLLREQDANGTVISNRFDGLDRCISRQITPGPGVATTTTFERYAYDGLSRLTAASNDLSFVITLRDSLGNLTTVNQNGRTIGRTYDGVGNCTSITYPSSTVVGYTYDACDQVSQITRCEGCGNPWLGDLVAAYAYDGPGRVARITRGNNINTRVFWNGIGGTPNAQGDLGWRQVSGVNHQAAGGGTTIDRRTFAYDRNQNKVQRAQVAPFTLGGEMKTNQFVYDALNRLVVFTRSSGTGDDVFKSYVLDGNGNRQFAFSNGLAQPYFRDNTPPPGPADFQMNQYTATPFGSQAFDENGNLIGRFSAATQLQYQYDYANRLVVVNDLSTGLLSPVVSFTYDALGRRISKTVHSSIPVTTEYVLDGPDDCDDKDPKVIETRVSGIVGKDFILDGSRSSDDEVVRLIAGQPQYFHHDDLGNVLALTDASGNVIERYEYDDFGAPVFLTSDGLPISTNASPVENTFLFHGMEWDGEVSLYFGHSQGATAGYFDSASGRYLLRAGVPLRFETSTTFSGNNPWSGPSSAYLKLGTANNGVERPGSGSARLSREVLKSFFEKGDHPTQSKVSRPVLKEYFEKGDHPTQGKLSRPVLKEYFEKGDHPTQGKLSRPVLKEYFEKGDLPTQKQ